MADVPKIPPVTRRVVLAGGAALAATPATPLGAVPAGVVVPPAATEEERALDALFRPAAPDPRLEEVRRLIVHFVQDLEEEPLADFAAAFRALKATAASGDEAAIRFMVETINGMVGEFTSTMNHIKRQLDEVCGA